MHSYVTEARPAATQAGTPERTMSDPQIPASLKSLEDEIAHIGSVADRLIARLQPVLRLEPTNGNCDSTASVGSPTACQLANCLADRTRTLARVREALCDLDNRIEL